MYGKQQRKARRKAPLAILPLVLLAAGLSIILVPALHRDMELNYDAQEYVALVEQAKSASTAQPLDMANSTTTTTPSQAGRPFSNKVAWSKPPTFYSSFATNCRSTSVTVAKA